jgi:hypothetical protein
MNDMPGNFRNVRDYQGQKSAEYTAGPSSERTIDPPTFSNFIG